MLTFEPAEVSVLQGDSVDSRKAIRRLFMDPALPDRALLWFGLICCLWKLQASKFVLPSSKMLNVSQCNKNVGGKRYCSIKKTIHRNQLSVRTSWRYLCNYRASEKITVTFGDQIMLMQRVSFSIWGFATCALFAQRTQQLTGVLLMRIQLLFRV